MNSSEAEDPQRAAWQPVLGGPAVLSTAGLGTWCWNASTDVLSGDLGCLRLLDAVGAPPGNLDSLIRLAHPADRNLLRVALHEAARNRAAASISFRIVGADFADRWLHCLMAAPPGAGGDADSLLVGVLGLASPAVQEAAAAPRRDLQNLLQSAPVASAKFDRNLQLVFANERFLETLRLARFDWQGRSLYDALPETPAAWREAIERCLSGSDIQIEVAGFERADGSQDHVEGQIYPWYDNDDRVGGVLLITDVTSTPTDTGLTQVVDHAPVGIAVAAPGGQVRYANPAWIGLTGRGRADIVGADVLGPVHADDRPDPMFDSDRLAASGTRQRDVRMVLPSGEIRWIELLSRPMQGGASEPDGILYAALDITGRARQQREAGQMLARLRELVLYLEQLRERERSQTAQNLQHGLYEVLFGLHAELERWSRHPAGAGNSAGGAGELALRSQSAVEQLRQVLFELTPPGVAELGFAGAMHRFCSDYSGHCGLPIELLMPPRPVRADEPLLDALYRIAREAIIDAAAHAGVTRIKVLVELTAGAVRLRVEDNGRVEPEGTLQGRGTGSGLLAASLRLRDLGGSLRVLSVGGAVTTVEVSIPDRRQ
jgi:PAS domain S-box-containing protein